MSDELAPDYVEPLPPVPAPGAVPLTRKKVFSSAVWIGLGFGYSQVIRLISNVILAHYLNPHAFGLMALAFTFLTFLLLFSDLGIRTSVVQNPRGDDPDFLNTAWTLQIIRGFVLFAASCLLAWPAAYWRPDAEPALLWLLPLFGVMSFVDGFISINILTLYRHLAQRRAVLIDVVTQTAGTATMWIWAVRDPGVLALAVGPLVTTVVRLALSHFVLPGPRSRLCWDRSALRELLHFARWIYLSTALSFLAGNVDKLLVSFQSVEMLGVYHIANQLSFSAVSLMAAVSSQLIFPMYSRLLQEGRDLRPFFGRMHILAGCLSALFISGLIAAGPTLIRCLYDQRYQDASWILPLLALGGWLQIAENNASAILFAQGKPKWPAVSNGVKVVTLFASVPLGLWLDGLRGLIIGFIVGDLARYISTAVALRVQHIGIFASDIAWTLFAVGVGLAGMEVGRVLFPDVPAKKWELLVRFGAESLAVLLIWGAAALLLHRRGYFRGGESRPIPSAELGVGNAQ